MGPDELKSADLPRDAESPREKYGSDERIAKANCAGDMVGIPKRMVDG